MALGAELASVTVIVWVTVFTVYVAVAELELASVTAIVWDPPAVVVGIVKFALVNEPVEFVLVAPLNVTVVPPKVAVSAEFAAKPLPETVTVEPALPIVGLGRNGWSYGECCTGSICTGISYCNYFASCCLACWYTEGSVKVA